MSIDLQNLAQFSIKQVQRAATQATTIPLAKLDLPNDSFAGKILDQDGIQSIMKKLDLLIAQASEKVAEASEKYAAEKALNPKATGSRQTWVECKKAQSALKELNERRAKFQQKPELVQSFLDEQRKAPNTSFLYDPLLSPAEKKAILEQKPEIIKLIDIYTQFPSLKSIITSKKYFDEKTVNEGLIYVDLSNALNGENMRRLSGTLPMSTSKVAQETGMRPQDVRRYINSGFFEPITLIDKQAGSEVVVNAIDWQSEVTQNGLVRLKRLRDLAPKYSKGIATLKEQGRPQFVPLNYLSQIGFGTVEEIEEALKNYKIPTTTVKGEEGLITVINIDSPKARGVLNYLETNNENLCSIEQMAKSAKTSPTVIEDAILSGQIVPIKESVSMSEKAIKINAASKKNQAFFERMQFQRELHQQENNSLTSLRNKLAWHFCPKTKSAASHAFGQNNELLNGIKKQIAILKDALGNPNLKPQEVEELEEQLEKLVQQEQIATAKTFGMMWDIAGEEEYKAGMKQAQEIIKQIQEQGVDSIEDESIRTIIQAYQS